MSENQRKRRVPVPLDDARKWVDTIIYATPEQKDAGVLVSAVTHSVRSFNTAPRVLVTSPEPMSGKTTWLDAFTYLCQNAWMTDPTSYALRAKFNEPEKPTCIFDEISKIFGESGLRGYGRPEYRILVESYRRSATLSLSIDRTATEVSSFCVAICAGLKTAAPKDLRSRSIIITMKPAPENLELDDSLDQGVEAIGRQHGERLHAWVTSIADELPDLAKNIRKYHPKLRGRKAQIWAPLFAIAEAAGGDWPERCRRAFVAIALDNSEKPILTTEQQVLIDAADYLNNTSNRYLTSNELLKYLRAKTDNKVYQAQSDRQMAMIMKQALGSTSVLTLVDRRKAKGWHCMPILQAANELEALLSPEDPEDVEDEFDTFFDVTETTETTV